MGERRGTKALELWCRRMTDGYPGVKIENMTTSWRDGLAFCAIIHRFRPDLIDFSKLKKNDVYHNNELAFRIAERHLGIPALLEPEDMVEFPVPDRLSILTYLSQFFQVFAGTQGSSQNRIAPKRAQTSPDHSIVSPASTSPPSKVALFGTGGKIHREPCAKCALPVFIAERLNVGKLLYHRTCFKCARCTTQLTLDNYYETENGEFCCETCPDEEKPPTSSNTTKPPPPSILSSPQNLNEESVLFRSMSDEEKTASLRAKFEIDEYSAQFETALEFPDDTKSSTLNSTQSKEFTMARTQFMQTQINNSSINSNSSSTSSEDSGNEDEMKKLNNLQNAECENELNNEQNDSGFPINNKLDTSVNIQISDSVNSCNENLVKTENIVDVTKDEEYVMENDINNSSLVKERKKLFETKQKSLESPKAEQMSIINNNNNENIDLDKSDSLASQPDTSIIVVSDSTDEEIKKESDDVIVITDSSTSNDNIINETSIDDSNTSVDKDETSEIKNEIPLNTEVEYPEELNPFDDDDEEKEVSEKSPKDSTNPFDEDEDEENDVVNISLKPTPSPRLKKKLIPSSGDRVSTPLYTSRISMTGDVKNTEPPTPATRKKKAITAPKISLNPFWSSGDEEDNDKSMDRLPVPTPRLSRTSTTTTDTQSNISSTVYGSNSSLSSTSTAPTGTLRKKKPAPKPPGIPLVKLRASESPESSKGSSPCPSIQQSPYLTPKHRKNRKAPPPPPPNVSTPFPNRQETFNELSINVSPIGTTETITKTINEMPQPDNNKIIEDEKIAKDETNRNRQSQEYNKNESLMENRRNSILNKSTHGKWKRRKGQAPSRPIPQKRTIKALPMDEVRRELDIIEIQLQGLEKQGVQIEKLIRQKCENQTDAENVDSMEDSLPSDAEELILQLFEVVNEKNELFRKQTELMYLKRQQRLEEEHADVEYQIRCLMLQPEANKTDFDKGREEALINRLVEIVEMRNEIIECLEMDRVREAEEDDCISNHLNMYTLKKSTTPIPEIEKSHKEKKKHKKEKRFKFKSSPKTDADKDIDETETNINNTNSSSSTKTEKKKKKHLKFF